MSPVGLEPTISAGERPQTYALDRVATGADNYWFKYINLRYVHQNKTVYQQVVSNKTQHVMLIARMVQLHNITKKCMQMRNHSEFLIGSAWTVST